MMNVWLVTTTAVTWVRYGSAATRKDPSAANVRSARSEHDWMKRGNVSISTARQATLPHRTENV